MTENGYFLKYLIFYCGSKDQPHYSIFYKLSYAFSILQLTYRPYHKYDKKPQQVVMEVNFYNLCVSVFGLELQDD